MTQFAKFFGIQLLQYGLVTWSYRAIAQAHYGNIIVADLLYAGVQFSVIKHVAKAESKSAWAGYTIGGAVGTVLATLVTQHFFGQ